MADSEPYNLAVYRDRKKIYINMNSIVTLVNILKENLKNELQNSHNRATFCVFEISHNCARFIKGL